MSDKIDFTVTYFNNISDVTNYDLKKRCRTSTIISRMKDPSSKLALKVTNLRLIDDPDKRKEAKKSLPVIMWQGMFKHRSNSGCDSLNGLMCFDIDHKTDPEIDRIKEDVAKWGCTYCCFRSPSGDGLKVIIRTNNYGPNRYGYYYQQIEKMFINQLGVKPDNNCEDIGRACYGSFDPELYYDPEAIALHIPYYPELAHPELAQQKKMTIEQYRATQISPTDKFLATLRSLRSPMTDEQIIKILDIRFQKFQDNYIDGHRTHSIFIQAKGLCEAGIDIEKAINYLESRFLPTGYDKEKLRYEVNRSYSKNAEMFGMKRGDYKPYSEYKKSKSSSN